MINIFFFCNKYIQMNNYQDNYYRTNPRRNAKCSPMLWGDRHKYYFNGNNSNNNLPNSNNINGSNNIEGFQNMNNNIQVVNNNLVNNNNSYIQNNNLGNNNINKNDKVDWMDNNLDNYQYLDNTRTKLKCSGGKALVEVYQGNDMSHLNMYDIDSKSLMKKQVLGDIKEIDNIHNNIDNNTMTYDKIQLLTMRNSMERAHYRMNTKVLQGREISFLNDDFFKGDYNRDYFLPATRINRSEKKEMEKEFRKTM